MKERLSILNIFPIKCLDRARTNESILKCIILQMKGLRDSKIIEQYDTTHKFRGP